MNRGIVIVFALLAHCGDEDESGLKLPVRNGICPLLRTFTLVHHPMGLCARNKCLSILNSVQHPWFNNVAVVSKLKFLSNGGYPHGALEGIFGTRFQFQFLAAKFQDLFFVLSEDEKAHTAATRSDRAAATTRRHL